MSEVTMCNICLRYRSDVYPEADCMVFFTSAMLFFFQAEDGIRDLVRSRGLGDVYKRQR